MRRLLYSTRISSQDPTAPANPAVEFGWLILAVCAVAIAVACLGCGSRQSTRPGETFDAGYVFADRVPRVSHAFVVRNTTGRAVKILDVVKSCGCTSFDVGKKSLAPGEETKLEINVSTPKAYQDVYSACTLKTDHPALADWQYTLRFTALPRVAFSAQHVNFGRISKTAPELSQDAFIDLYDSSVVPLDEHNFSVPEGLSVQLLPEPEKHHLASDIWSARYRFSVKLVRVRGLEGYGQHTKSIGLQAPSGARASLEVVWRHDPPIVAAPSVIGFGRVSRRATSDKRLLFLHSTDGKQFRIVSAECEPGAPTVATLFEKRRSDQHTIEFTLAMPRDFDSPVSSGMIVLQTDDDASRCIQIPWSAITESGH
jgi:hypothetical protein